MKIKIITNDQYSPELAKVDKNIFAGVISGLNIDREEIKRFISDADVLMLASESVMPFDKELIDACKNVKYISLDTTDTSWIDIAYAAEKGIVVSNCPHASTEAVAEHVMAVMLNFAKQIHPMYRDMYLRGGEIKSRLAFELKGKTLGVLGLGNIGSRLAEIASSFGMKVVAWNRSPKESAVHQIASLESVLEQSDFLSLHVAAGTSTVDFLDGKKIDKIRRGAYVINLVDKSIVDNDSMINAILEGKIAGYCVELWNLSESSEHEIYGLENVMTLPAIGWYTKESLERTFNISLSNVQRFVRGETINRVN